MSRPARWEWPAEIEPRVRLMLEVILRNRATICAPKKGVLELHFNGKHVSGRLVSQTTIGLPDDSDGEPPEAA